MTKTRGVNNIAAPQFSRLAANFSLATDLLRRVRRIEVRRRFACLVFRSKYALFGVHVAIAGLDVAVQILRS